ncbi:MAG TPA: hypothetical protein VGD65_04785 [Chryseosolibacter sp.]
MGVVVMLSAVAEIVVTILYNKSEPTAIIYNLYYALIFGALCWYYYEVVFKYKNRRYFYFGIAVYVISLLLVAFRHSMDIYQGEMWAITGAILVFFGIVYNNYQVEKPPLFDKNLYSGLIFNGAVIFYFSFNFFLFMIANYVLTELTPDMSRMAWAFHNVNNVIKNIAFAFGFYYTMRRRVNLSDEEVEKIQWHRVN